MGDLLHIAEETRQFNPPYIPSRYLQDLLNSDPAELVSKVRPCQEPDDWLRAALARAATRSHG